MIYPLNSRKILSVTSVGGKARALMEAGAAGLRVPEGFILGTEFFEPWLDTLRGSEAWKMLSSGNSEEARKASRLLKEKTRTLTFDPERTRLLRETLEEVFGNRFPLMAVRSSSPEEDTGESSFAGAYESILGATDASLDDSIRAVFSSCLDERITSYKRERGYDPSESRIAVIVQRLLAADRSGVAFSANPLNNDLDEVLINAAFGLGESIVSGVVTPDTYVFNRAENRITGKTIGKKETGLFAKGGGGSERKAIANPSAETLTDDEIREVADLCVRSEEMMQKEADIEWAYEKGTLYLLQTRPITTLFRVPPSMRTQRGKARKLYIDFTLIGQGVRKPLSVLGIEFYSILQNSATRCLLGIDIPGLDDGFFGGVEGRSYMNVSNLFKVPGGVFFTKKLSREDRIITSVIESLPLRAYRTHKKPEKLRFFLFRVMKNSMRYTRLKYEPYNDPMGYRDFFIEESQKRTEELDRIAEKCTGLKDLSSALEDWFSDFLISVSLAMTSASHSIALESIRKTFKRQDRAYHEVLLKLERGLPHNNTVAMGLELEKLAAMVSFRTFGSYKEWIAACGMGKVPQTDRKAFEEYLASFGYRSPVEIDAAAVRPSDNPALFYKTLNERAQQQHGSSDGQAQFEKAWKEREEAFEFLKNSIPEGKKRRKFEKDYGVWVNLGGYREIHKDFMVRAIYCFRSRAMTQGERFVNEGRLDRPEEIFNLTIGQIEEAVSNPGIDLKKTSRANMEWRENNWTNVREFPPIFDSRGRILRPPVETTENGDLTGQGISPGVAQGRAKVLNYPDEKPLFPGEILIARATDPGWTPLFVPAAAIVLEVGGPAQHGAVVAREYGKPCVSGIINSMELFRDGDLILVDGSNGVVRIVEERP